MRKKQLRQKEKRSAQEDQIMTITKEFKELGLEELDKISGGYIVEDSDGYHVIHDTDGYEIATFQEDQYDFMMMLITKKWKNSPEW